MRAAVNRVFRPVPTQGRRWTSTKDAVKMSEQPGLNLDSLDIEQARRIDAICRRFEADRRAGRTGTGTALVRPESLTDDKRSKDVAGPGPTPHRTSDRAESWSCSPPSCKRPHSSAIC
jgi:hypothetical protein